jgi:hypothetical protein
MYTYTHDMTYKYACTHDMYAYVVCMNVCMIMHIVKVNLVKGTIDILFVPLKTKT